MLDRYDINVYLYRDTNGESYYIAYLPAFGESTCSAAGDTVCEAIEVLTGVLADVISYFKDMDRSYHLGSHYPNSKVNLR